MALSIELLAPNRRSNKRKTYLLDRPGEVLFDFGENEKIELKNLSSEPLLLEGNLAEGDGLVFPDEEGMIPLGVGRKVQISDPSGDLYYLPGFYAIRDERGQEFLFEVKGIHNVDKQGIDSLVLALENLERFLTLNFHRPKESEEGFFLFREKEFLLKEGKEFPNRLYSLLMDLKGCYRKRIVRSARPGKEDRHTIRKNLERSDGRIERYVVKKVFDYESEENAAIKRSLLLLLEDLSKTRKENAALSKQEIFAKVDPALFSEIDDLLIALERKIHALLSASPLFDVAPKESVLVSSPSLEKIESFRKAFPGSRKPGKGFDRQRTSKLFELYGFVILDAALTRQGFQKTEWENGAYEENRVFWKYRRGEETIRLRYGPRLVHYSQEKEGLVKINSKHDNPDFVLEAYRKEIFLSALVLDVKYYSEKNLFGPKRDKRLDETLDDYAQFGYKQKDGHVKRGVVKSLDVLFPDLGEKILPMENGFGNYLGVYPGKEKGQSEATKEISLEIERLFQ